MRKTQKLAKTCLAGLPSAVIGTLEAAYPNPTRDRLAAALGVSRAAVIGWRVDRFGMALPVRHCALALLGFRWDPNPGLWSI